jgi:hypothetical protein
MGNFFNQTLLCGLLLTMGISVMPRLAQADVLSEFDAFQETRLREGLVALATERRRVFERFSAQEIDCLDRFFSASCLEDVRQGYARALRELDLLQESLGLDIRRLQASARQRARQDAVVQHSQAIEQRRTKP